jgi:multidrug transporter EmrE-like cation transporter
VELALPRWFFNPYVQLGFDAVLVTAAELMLKKGATTGAQLPPSIAWLGFGALASMWTWIGILAYLLSFACWLYVLRHIPISIAFGLISIAQVLVPLGAWMFLGEAISVLRWMGIAFVLAGTICIARTIMITKVEL